MVIRFFDLMPLSGVSSVFFGTLEKFPLLAIPFFIYSGFVMERGGISHKLISFVNGIIGKVSGGLAYVVIVVGVLLAGISGSGPADVAALGSVLLPSMTKLKYDRAFCCGLISVVGSLGIVVPPSIAFIVYGIVSNTSIVKLFLAGVVPGVLSGIACAIPVYFISKRRGYSGEDRTVSGRLLYGLRMPSGACLRRSLSWVGFIAVFLRRRSCPRSCRFMSLLCLPLFIRMSKPSLS